MYIKNKMKIVLSVILMAIIVVSLSGITSFAESGSRTLVLSRTRYVKENNIFSEKGAYTLNIVNEHPIFQILSKDGTNNITGTNYYCLNATVGNTWNSSAVGTGVTYNKSFDLVTEKTSIASQIGAYSNVLNNNYGPVMWILDNMYTEGGITKNQVLNNAGIVYGPNPLFNGSIVNWHYDSETKVWNYGYEGYEIENNGSYEDVILSSEEVEAVQQAAIWYFTNHEQNDFNCYTPTGQAAAGSWFEFNESNETKKKMKQEQAAILYNYFIDHAEDKTSYTSQAVGTLNVEYTGSSNKKYEEDGDNYIIGPIQVKTTNGTIINANGLTITPNTGAKITNVNGVEKAFKANEDFYITIPKANVTNGVKIDVSGTAPNTTKLLWVSTNAVEQPVVEVKQENNNISASLTVDIDIKKHFDLALRKIITKVNNTNTIRNENRYDATRTININNKTIPETATYKHRKDPVVVNTGDKITYEIRIYNEGEIDGYATKIVDQLPTGLTSAITTGTITSSNGNVYSVSYNDTTKKLELTMTNKVYVIPAFNGTTLSYDTIEVEANVTQQVAQDGQTKYYLTNVAYIAEEYDKNNNKIEADRGGNESDPTVSPSASATDLNSNSADSYKGNESNSSSVYSGTNNDIYFKGQEDDDDFEKVVVLPKGFDLALRKFITKIGETEINDRVPDIKDSEKEKLANGNATFDNGTTLAKTHTKDKRRVKIGDKIVYTIRVYNEGEVDGYASKVTDYLPAGLTLLDGSTINTTNGWVQDVQNPQKITSTKLSDDKIKAFDKNTKALDYKDLQVECIVNENATDENLKNIAEITECLDENKNPINDTDSSTNNVHTDNYSPTNPTEGRGEEDDDDSEDLQLVSFDLALRKFITKVSTDGNFENTKTTKEYNRAPNPDTSELKSGYAKTATYNHSKEPVYLEAGSRVLYTIRVYNEGEIAGYASQITDKLPEYLDFLESTDEYIKSINDKWTYDSNTRTATTNKLGNAEGKPVPANATTKLNAFNNIEDDGNGSGLSYVDVQIICKVNEQVSLNKKLTNIAQISEYMDETGATVIPEDRDSKPVNVQYPDNFETYKDDELNKEYVPGQEDDDDFEKVAIRGTGKYDVILIKEDENGVQLQDKATFEVNGVEKEVTGYLVIADDVEINASNVNTPDTYTIVETVPPDKYCEFEGKITIIAKKKISADGKSYELDGNLVYSVTDEEGNALNTKDAKVYLKDGNIYVEVIDHEIKDFDLALRKFITNIDGKEITSREPKVEYKDDKITYSHSKDDVKVGVGSVITYTLRAYNEGEIAGFAEKITDDIPEFLEYLPENSINRKYRWVMFDKDGKSTTKVKDAVKIVTDYTSKAYGETLMKSTDSTNGNSNKNPNLLEAFNKNGEINENNPDYVDVKVAFKVKDPNSNKTVITNKAQISEDADEEGNPGDDIDSTPDEWNEGEDDQDIENLSVEYFDLSLLKYVTKAIVTENGKTKTIKTGNNGSKKDTTPKVEIHRKKINTTTVKFEYVIKVTNEGDIEGYATEIKDYVPKGLKFYKEDNKGWKNEGNNVISTELLKNTLLKPGQSATVKVVLRWVNGENNLSLKVNTAEISKDKNEKGIPDRDSTPNNKKPGEDDIDDSPVLITISTGAVENTIKYVSGTLIILAIIGAGLTLIKKYVL